MPPRPPRRPDRTSLLDALAAESFDLLVIGGGITGCGIARDAALRGVRVALVEKDDFASGTSSRSSRLVHGGIRYLEHGHLHLVFEASAERRRLLALAPHLVRPLEFTWPVYVGARVPAWKLRAGLAIYDALALFRNVGTHRGLSPTEILAREPALRRDGLRGGARYFDAATDDARLTLANAIGALEAGAVVVNHACVTGARDDHAGSRTVLVRDTLDDARGEIAVRTRTIVNATGPWSDAVRALLEPDVDAKAAIRGSKGVHVAVPRERLANHGALTLLSPRDGRVMFVLPAAVPELSIVGTTDTFTTASPDEVRASEADVAYLLESANDFFPDAHLTRSEVVAAWAGIRPLVPAACDDSVSASREHAVTRGPAGVVTVTGGKLTTYRVMAEDALRALPRAAGRGRPARKPTRTAPLPGAAGLDVRLATTDAVRTVGDPLLGAHLVQAFGSRWTDAWAWMGREADGRERVHPMLPYTFGELRHAAREELACTLGDLLIRRTHLAFETRDQGRSVAVEVAACVAPVLGWDTTRQAVEVRRYEQEIDRIFAVEADAAIDRQPSPGGPERRRVAGGGGSS
jgi:glycerol-3-phosphate dehydrogenase